MASPQHRVEDLIALFSGPDARAAELLCDRHPGDAVAFTVIEPDLSQRDFSFAELRHRSARIAASLSELGVGRGDRVATLMSRSAELVFAVLAIWRLGAVHVPLFTALAPPAVAARIEGSDTKVVFTETAQRAKLEAVTRRVIVITTGDRAGEDRSYRDLLYAPPLATSAAVGGEGTIIELFTSGTTGAPKGVPVPLKAVAAMVAYQEFGLDHQPSDVFWNIADPGWAYGLYQAVLGPLALGRRSLLLHAGFSPTLTWSVLAGFGVTNFAAGPTVYRALRATGYAPPTGLVLRHCSSAGEPLPPDVADWAERELGVPIFDHYGQTELGMAAANAWHPDLRTWRRPGSMGRALPGWRLEALCPDSAEVAPPGERGRLAVDLAHSPLMWFTGYRDAPARTAERFTADGRWYLTGDTAAKDNDGNLYFAARDDDIILMAGYRIGPSEVESVLERHDAVAEAAAIGVPDELRGEVLVAYVVLLPGHEPDATLAEELRQLVKTGFAAHAYPRTVHFVPELPRTPSGKLQRSLLRQAEPHPR